LNFQGRISEVENVEVERVETVGIDDAVVGHARLDFCTCVTVLTPGSLNGSIESKKSAEAWNLINDENP